MSSKHDIIFNINIDNTLLSQVMYTTFLGINLDRWSYLNLRV